MERTLEDRWHASFRLACMALIIWTTPTASPPAISGTAAVSTGIVEERVVEAVPFPNQAPFNECTQNATERHAGAYETGSLEGKAAGDLYGKYFGLTGRFPANLQIDFDNTIAKLWDRKIARRGSAGVVRTTGNNLVTEYHTCNSGRMSLAEYQRNIAQVATATYQSIDWNAAGEKQFRSRNADLNMRRSNLLKRISENIGGRSLVAYAMTELLPSHTNGAFNRDYLDFMLTHGGRRYLESLPALNDRLTSFGPFQFTANAVYDVRGTRRGASRMNMFLPEDMRIPGSTMHLRGDNHSKAAYLFAVQNLADMIRGLNSRQLATLERIADSHALDILQFIAVAHNKPAVGRKSARKWLDNQGRSSFLISCPRASRIYATKTINNYKALSPTT